MLGVLGAVVAGHFWCSYAWVSLTPTTPARPRAPVFCTRVRACARFERVCACAGACAGALLLGARVRSSRRGVLVGGGVVGGVPLFRWWCTVVAYLFSL